MLIHPIVVADYLSRFAGTGRFQIVVEQRAGESFERATLRVGVKDAGVAGTDAARDLAGRISGGIKGALLIQMDVDVCAEDDIPAEAAGPSFARAIVNKSAA